MSLFIFFYNYATIVMIIIKGRVMRVVSGSARGTKLDSIDSLSTRPTQDRVKESLFNIIFDEVYDSNFLDLFAGSGAVGIEALSRGASFAVFCEINKEALKFIYNNLKKTRLSSRAKVYNVDYKKYLEITKEKFDIIFIYPPYKADISVDAVVRIKKNNLLKRNGFIVIETDEYIRDVGELEKIEDVEVFDHRKYGRANLIFIKYIC